MFGGLYGIPCSFDILFFDVITAILDERHTPYHSAHFVVRKNNKMFRRAFHGFANMANVKSCVVAIGGRSPPVDDVLHLTYPILTNISAKADECCPDAIMYIDKLTKRLVSWIAH